MKKQRIIKLVSAVLSLIILVSCTPQNKGGVSSVLTENENQNIVSSEISKDETSSIPITSDKNSEKEEVNSMNSVSNQDDGLSEKKEKEISACVQKGNYEYQQGQYFGTYNGYDIVLISQINGVEYRDAQVMKIAEYAFFIGDTEKLITYKDNSYILLSEAYNKGIVTKADIQKIQNLYGKYYSEFNNERFPVVVKKDPNNPNKRYTAADFPTIKIEKIIQSQWSSNELGQELTIVLPTHNRRNIINAIKELKKMDNVLSAELGGVSYPE